MITLTLRTDKPLAELGLYKDLEQIAYETWEAHRQLAETLHTKITELLQAHNYTLNDLDSVACYAGPGSFTGLRIGITTANALAYALELPIIAETGDDWQKAAIQRIQTGETDHLAQPEYGAEVHITKPKS